MQNANVKCWDVFYGGAPVPLLSEQECTSVSQQVHAAKDYWLTREVIPGHPIKFYTLGGASYLDMDAETYNKHKSASADKLREDFADLYARLCANTAEILGHPCVIAEELAPPGFHIYRGNPLSGTGLAFGGKIHNDMPHLNHADKFASIDDVLSFTLPICMPKGGGGMYYWTDKTDLNIFGFAFQKTPEQYQWLDAHKKRVDYRLGEMVLHDGKTAHQLANLCSSGFDDWRITLQGHGIFSAGQWHLYF